MRCSGRKAPWNFRSMSDWAAVYCCLELMQAPWLVWLLGGTLTVGRVIYAYGVITQYGPLWDVFLATWFVYAVAGGCVYYGFTGAM